MIIGARDSNPRNKGTVMRRLVVALGLIALTSGAVAGEFEIPTLRGSSPFAPAPPKYTGWGGFYAGAQLGYGSSLFDFADATKSLVAFALRELALENEQHPSEWQVLGSRTTGGSSVGGFAGYNSQWDDVILGVDVNYSRATFSANAPLAPITRATSAGGNSYLVNITGNASMNITDFGSARMRAGYVMSNFLPFATFGVAFGRANIARSATVSGTETTSGGVVTPFSFTESETKNNAFIYGLSWGLGADILVLPNVFLRGEYEYVKFYDVSGIKSQVQTARVGAGFKF
jgi:outer membrane immunogenic protein